MIHTKSILVIGGSVRPNRISPDIARWVADRAATHMQARIETIDLRDWPLPMDAEPGIPATGIYESLLTKAWSAKIASADAIIFVTPQYNWGYPAPLKNAIDHLYREWTGKPALIVTYGGHGGGKCASALRVVLDGLKMKPVPTMPSFSLPRPMIEANTGIIDAEAVFAASVPELDQGLTEFAEALAACTEG